MLIRIATKVRALVHGAFMPVAVVAGLVLVAGGLMHVSASATPDAYTSDEEMIKTFGSARAFKAFAREVALLTVGEQHSRAHEFGRALFDVEGDLASTFCGSSYHYGCAHGYMARAFQLYGMAKVSDFFRLCEVTPYYPSCVHGIGHGVVATLGYDEGALRRALDICATMVPDDVVMGCAGGAVMEYTQQGARPGARAFSVKENGYYSVCENVQLHSRVLCYFWLPDWWRREEVVDARNVPVDDFPALGRHCSAIVDNELRMSCFAGIGYVIASLFRYTALETIDLCDSASEDSAARFYCKGTAAFIYYHDAKTVDGTDRLCATTNEYKEHCRTMMLNGPKDFTITFE